MTFRTKFLLFVSICVPPNNPITACGATSFPGYHSFPKWAIAEDFNFFLNKGKGKSAKGVRGTAKGGSPAVSVMIITKKDCLIV